MVLYMVQLFWIAPIFLEYLWPQNDRYQIFKIFKLDIWVLIEAARNFHFYLVCQTSQFSIYKVTEHQVPNQYLKNWKIRDIIDTDEWHKICSLISNCTMRKKNNVQNSPSQLVGGPAELSFFEWNEFFFVRVCNPPRVSNFTLIQIYWFECFVVYHLDRFRMVLHWEDKKHSWLGLFLFFVEMVLESSETLSGRWERPWADNSRVNCFELSLTFPNKQRVARNTPGFIARYSSGTIPIEYWHRLTH